MNKPPQVSEPGSGAVQEYQGPQWRTIATYQGDAESLVFRQEVDLWLTIHPTPRSMGMGDSFRVVDAYNVRGKWLHIHNGREEELYAEYITHWMPKPEPPHQDAVGDPAHASKKAEVA